jgi:equilibrative nucleoside transporter 1/2/3
MSLAPADASSIASSSPPKDPWNLAYCIYLLLGAGYLVPWNAFISAIDYFVLLYPDGQIGRVFSILYMIPCLIAVLLLTFFGRGIPSHLRVNAGLALFLAMLLLVPLMNLLFISDASGTWATYAVTVLAAPINGVADALVQGSIVGSSGELPSRYMQALMIGTAISGTYIWTAREKIANFNGLDYADQFLTLMD